MRPEIVAHSSDVIVRELFGELLQNGNEVRFQVRGWSMHPFIKDKEFITVRALEQEQAKIGDILARQSLKDKCIIVHRLVRKRLDHDPPFFLFAGDNVPFHDLPVSPAAYRLAKVIAVEKDGRKISLETRLNAMHACLTGLILLGLPRELITLRRWINKLCNMLYMATIRGLSLLRSISHDTGRSSQMAVMHV